MDCLNAGSDNDRKTQQNEAIEMDKYEIFCIPLSGTTIYYIFCNQLIYTNEFDVWINRLVCLIFIFQSKIWVAPIWHVLCIHLYFSFVFIFHCSIVYAVNCKIGSCTMTIALHFIPIRNFHRLQFSSNVFYLLI